MEKRAQFYKSIKSLQSAQRVIRMSKWIQEPYRNEICEEYFMDIHQEQRETRLKKDLELDASPDYLEDITRNNSIEV